MLGFEFVAGLHVKQREIRVNELFARVKLLGLVAFGDGGGKIAPAIMRHAERQLRVEMRRLDGQQRLEPGNGAVKVAAAEGEHRFVVLFLQCHVTW